MANLTDITENLNGMITILKVEIGFTIFYFIFNNFFNKTLTNNKKIKSVDKYKKSNNEKLKSSMKVSLKK